MRSLLLLGPDRHAVSGISTHLNQLMDSRLASQYRMLHFRVGSEGRSEGRLAKLGRMLFSPWRLAWVLLRERPAIVHINTAMDLKAFWRDLAYLLVARLLGRRIVYQIHGGALPEAFTRDRAGFAWLVRAVCRIPDSFVLIARIEDQAWRRFMPDLSTRVIANAIDTRWVPESNDSGLRASGELRLVYLGRIVESKGLFEAVEALAQLAQDGVPARLTIAGSGADEARLRGHVEQLGIADRVSFAGPVFGRDKERFWLQADVLVFPTWSEGLPYSLLEAMAAGVLPITCPVGAIPDVITDRRDGLLVPLRDPVALAAAIRWVHEHRDEARTIAQAASQRVSHQYTVERLAADFDDVYSRL
jgi:glycosyltransferase involved in cell wall biosynthesis